MVSATILESTDGWMSKMDPYPQIDFIRGDGQVRNIRGPTHEGGHKAPKWDWACEIYYGGEARTPLSDEIKIKFAIWEEDMASADDFIGETQAMKLMALLSGGQNN